MRAHYKPLDAMILVGGRGTRLQGAVSDRPKPMAEVADRPFVEWLLLALRAQGVRRVIFCTGYMSEIVEAHFRDGRQWDMEVVYSRDPMPLGTAGAIRYALSQVHSDCFLVMNGDSYARVDISRLQEAHTACAACASLWLVSVNDCRRYGSVEIGEDGAVQAFREKLPEKRAGLINAGIYLLERKVAESIPEGRDVSIESEIFPHFIGHGLYAVVGKGPFLDIGTPEAYKLAEHFFALRGAGMKRRRFAVLDRDGTIIVERQYLSDPRQVELIPGAASGLRRLCEMGLGLAVVTNQSAIGRGFFDKEQLNRIHQRLDDLLEEAGVHLDGIYVCPHTPEDNCGCRKPQQGLVELAAQELNFDPSTSFVIGDKACDIELGQRVGATTFLVRTGYGAEVADEGIVTPDYVVDDVRAAVPVIQGILAAEERIVTDEPRR